MKLKRKPPSRQNSTNVSTYQNIKTHCWRKQPHHRRQTDGFREENTPRINTARRNTMHIKKLAIQTMKGIQRLPTHLRRLDFEKKKHTQTPLLIPLFALNSQFESSHQDRGFLSPLLQERPHSHLPTPTGLTPQRTSSTPPPSS